VIEALAGEPGKLQAELDAVHALFKDAVKRTRSEISDDALRGSVYLADEAMKMDLIDSIQSFERTVERALELGDIMQKNPKIYV
jgi:serine protease SohB